MLTEAASQTSRPIEKRQALGLPADRFADTLALIGSSMRFARNTEIYGEDEPVEYLYRVVTGVVRVAKLLSDGRRQISSFHFAGETFGLEDTEEHQFCAEAITDCVIVLAKRRAALELAERDAEIGRRLWSTTMRDLGRARDHMLLLGRKTASEKVAAFLLEMAARTGSSGMIELPMSRYDIADYLGLTIETVSRTLSELDDCGVIAMRSARRLELCRPQALARFNA